MPRLIAMGVDGARGGWAAACLYADEADKTNAMIGSTCLCLFEDIDALATFVAGTEAVMALDIPIGLLDSVDFRICDMQARKLLGARASTVFAPPARYMLSAVDYPAIRALVSKRREADPAAKSLSAQAAGIVPKVREVDDWVRAHPDSERWLFECHPELSFSVLNDGTPLSASKHSAAGLMRRLRLVRDAFPDAEQRLAEDATGRQAVLADLLDAYAALSTAVLCARGDQRELGEGKRDPHGIIMRMVL